MSAHGQGGVHDEARKMRVFAYQYLLTTLHQLYTYNKYRVGNQVGGTVTNHVVVIVRGVISHASRLLNSKPWLVLEVEHRRRRGLLVHPETTFIPLPLRSSYEFHNNSTSWVKYRNTSNNTSDSFQTKAHHSSIRRRHFASNETHSERANLMVP